MQLYNVIAASEPEAVKRALLLSMLGLSLVATVYFGFMQWAQNRTKPF